MPCPSLQENTARLEGTLTPCLLPFSGPAKEKSSEELGEVQALWEALRQDLDSCK